MHGGLWCLPLWNVLTEVQLTGVVASAIQMKKTMMNAAVGGLLLVESD